MTYTERLLETPIGVLDEIHKWLDNWFKGPDCIEGALASMDDHGLTWDEIRPYQDVLHDIASIRECIDAEVSPDMLRSLYDGEKLSTYIARNEITPYEARQLWEDIAN